MQIDYFTIIAQIINFLILVYLLKRFLYKPFLRAMDERENKIISRIREAEQKRKDAEREAESYRKTLQELSDERQEMNDRALKDAQILQNDLMKKLRDNVEASRANWYEDLNRQKEALIADLGQHAGEQIYSILRRALQDIADEDLESQILNVFIKRLKEMDALEKEKLDEFYGSAGRNITIRSTFEISDKMRREIQEIVNEQSGAEVKIQYLIAPELICGVEMSAYNTRIGWSIDSYLSILEADLSEVLAQRAAGEKSEDGVQNGSER